MAVSFLLLACNIPGLMPSQPEVTIQFPIDGASLPLGEPIVITAVASDLDGSGVTQVELFANGESVKLIESPDGGQDLFDVAFTWVPHSEGHITLTVIAYREDGSPSNVATVTVLIVGVSVEPIATVDAPRLTSSPSEQTIEPSDPSTPDQVAISGRVIREASFRVGPGPACTIIGGIKVNELITLYAYSADRRWIQTSYAGQLGWISTAAVAPEDDTNLLPITSVVGCEGCGDHVCSPVESCTVCSRDCGTCVPPTATPTKTPTATPTKTPTKTITPTASSTSAPTSSPVPTTVVPSSPEATATDIPTNSPTDQPPTVQP